MHHILPIAHRIGVVLGHRQVVHVRLTGDGMHPGDGFGSTTQRDDTLARLQLPGLDPALVARQPGMVGVGWTVSVAVPVAEAAVGVACAGMALPKVPRVTASATAPKATTPRSMWLSRDDAFVEAVAVGAVPLPDVALAEVTDVADVPCAPTEPINPTSTRS